MKNLITIMALLIGAFIAFFIIKTKDLKLKITENFRLGEFVKTSTGLFNYPDETALANIEYMAKNVLQPLRNIFGAIKITSGYRSTAVNEAVGGVGSSKHLNGKAVDIKPLEAEFEDVFNYLQSSNIPVSKVIWEKKGSAEWLHIEAEKGVSNAVFLTAEYNPKTKDFEFRNA